MIGEVVAGYRLTQKLGEGGTGETYLGENTSLGQKAAIKLLFPQMCTDAALIGRFLADVKAASLVNHSGIADLYDCGVLPSGRAFVIVEHLQGKTLTDALIELGQVSDMESLADIAWQLATMLRGAHEAGIVHAALKPDGIFLTFPPAQAPRPLVKLLDFGMAKFRLGVRHSQTGSLLGAPLYMSPEIGRGLGTVDHRADIYSLGCIMFEMACGRPPFVREGQGELIVAHATEPAPFVSSLEPSIPPAIDQLIGRMLTKNPLTRPQSMGDVAAVLEKFFKCPTPVADQPAAPPPPVFPRPNAPGPVSPAAVASASAPVSVGTDSTLQLPNGWRTLASGPQVIAPPVPAATADVPVNHPRRATVETALLPPTEQSAAGSTALLPPEPRPSWLAQVRQKTTMIVPGAKNLPGGVPAPIREEQSRPTRRRSADRPLAAGSAASNRRVGSSINVPIVVVSAAILLVLAAAVLLFRRESGGGTDKKQSVPGRVEAASSAKLDETPTVPPSPTIPARPAQPAAEAESADVEQGPETDAQVGQTGRGARRVRKATPASATQPVDNDRRRRPW